jgi:hypothetical protein
MDTIPARLAHVTSSLDTVKQRLPGLTDEIVIKFKQGFTDQSNGVVKVLVDLLNAVWPSVNRFGVKPIVHVSNLMQNIGLWALPFWATCVSISAHFLILGQIIIVIELWARRRDMMPLDGAESDDEYGSGRSLSGSSSSSSHSPSGSDADPNASSDRTIEYESKRPPDNQAKESDDIEDDDVQGGNQKTFVF